MAKKTIKGKAGYRKVTTKVAGYSHKVKPHTRTVWKKKKASGAKHVKR